MEREVSDELERTVKLLADLQSLRGRSCKRCESALCHHETLFRYPAWASKIPLDVAPASPLSLCGSLCRCAISYGLSLVHRPCHRAGWAWANREEGYEPGALPGCLWPSPRNTGERYREAAVEKPNEPNEAKPGMLVIWAARSRVELRMRLRAMKPRQVLRITATDLGAPEDIPAMVRLTGHTLLNAEHPQYWIERKED